MDYLYLLEVKEAEHYKPVISFQEYKDRDEYVKSKSLKPYEIGTIYSDSRKTFVVGDILRCEH